MDTSLTINNKYMYKKNDKGEMVEVEEKKVDFELLKESKIRIQNMIVSLEGEIAQIDAKFAEAEKLGVETDILVD